MYNFKKTQTKQMGQALPLPKRIPKPTAFQLKQLNSCGIIVEDSTSAYVTYTLPEEWKMVDNSSRIDLPNYCIVDNLGMVRFTVTGAWKGSYDNDLILNYIKDPYAFNPVKNHVYTETGPGHEIGILGQVLDPLHRPPTNPIQINYPKE